jgi:glycosyltransferase involved in cell wall biosynthesis
LVVNEAMACGLPVIVSRECGCAETLVEDGRNGWTIDPKDPMSLAQALDRVMSLSEAKRRQMGDRSFEIISNWGLEQFCDGVWQAVQCCLKIPEKNYAVPVVDPIILKLWNGRYRPV